MPERRLSPMHPADLRVRGGRLFKENRPDCSSDSAAYASIAGKLGLLPLHASRMAHSGGARRLGAAGPQPVGILRQTKR